MSQRYRLSAGGRIDRSQILRFYFDGKAFAGVHGDTLASALLANGVHLVGRSLKYHRPRGILSAGAEEPNALVTLCRDRARITPNLSATQVELYDGLVAVSQNRYPSLRCDVGVINDVLFPLFPAGFYYKTFMWPRAAWKRVYEPIIRAVAGQGRAPSLPDPDRYSQRYTHCDVLVVGAGPAGLAAALSASETGARVILCDEQAEFGGSLLSAEEASIDGMPVSQWLAQNLGVLHARRQVTLLSRTTAFGYFAHNFLGLLERLTDHLPAPDRRLARERLWLVRAKEVVLATGAIERPLVFPGNDRPGVMLADAARVYLSRYGVAPGERVAIATAHDHAYRAALALHLAGVTIAGIADAREHASGEWSEAASAAGLPISFPTVVTGTRGRLRIRSATFAPSTGGPGRPVECDLLLMSGGFTPNVSLFSQSRGTLRFDPEHDAYLPEMPAERTRSAGACRAVYGLATVLADGYAAGAQAANAAGFSNARSRASSVEGFGLNGNAALFSRTHERYAHRGKAFVDFQNDVTEEDLLLGVREGFHAIEHIKRYTTIGMATDQGKTSNMNSLGLVADALGKPIPQIGHTTFRMPYTPVTFGALAGANRADLFAPIRTTPMHPWAEEHGAVFEDVGLWKRAFCYPRPGEDEQRAVARECLAVRSGCGLFDASTLGKIEVVGADAAEFLNRIYVNELTKLAPGRCRYAVMLREDGFVLDDGVIGRLAPDRFHVTTTTGGAARVLAVMEDYLQTVWSGLDVWLTPITEQWAVVALQGPRARTLLASLLRDIDISAAAFPHMSTAEARLCGVAARVFRISFTGELGFEVNVPADHGRTIWETILHAGQADDVAPYGTQAMHILRAEKGYIIVGQETDGTATPDDVGLSWLIGKTKTDFIGKRSLARPSMCDRNRKQLVGLLANDPEVVLEEGAHVVTDPSARVPATILGHVTSSYHSAVLGRSIALAMVRNGRGRMGETVFVSMAGHRPPARVTSAAFYDPQGARLDG
jgi:sarcosine oxidase subunit alpha